MELIFKHKYTSLTDKEIVTKIITLPYNEEAATYLLYDRYSPKFRKLCRDIYNNLDWYDDCVDDLFDYLKGKAYSDTYYIYKECCNSLQIKDSPKVYITRKIRGINALSVEIKSKKLILISRQFIVRLTPKEQAFILGHELGHHQQGNLVCHTINGLIKSAYDVSGILGTILDDTLKIPLKHWHRDSEFNADRAGYLCCKDWQTIETLFKKISERKMQYSSIAELYAEHPFVKTRIEKLQNYIHSL